MPTVSVLMPTYNQAAYLPRALAGLDAQTFSDFEIIVCDDGSTDDTAKILKSSDISYVTHPKNCGTAEAINFAGTFATGKYWTWVSSDNVMHANWLDVLVSEMERHNLGAVYSAYNRIEADGTIHEVRPGEYKPDRLVASENCYFGPSFLIREDVWHSHRGGSSHDYDNWSRVEELCWERELGIKFIDRVLCDYYRGEWNTCQRRPDLFDAPRWRAEAIKRRDESL